MGQLVYWRENINRQLQNYTINALGKAEPSGGGGGGGRTNPA